ncbi:serine hydrolase [Streptomyces glomeratus]|uniref:Serine hydrolase n=1 Tax=Streptomyces glomeratus TaxID=284452 RepID=A0ABP6LKR4_9ACTN|nr:serine hydrolase [Streptomyces glomeratus]MCF1509673.1 class A beta-lactamase-related serine hydrolase [Streptomyces glomeratus]
MLFRPFSPRRPETAGGRRRKRTTVCAGVLLASVTGLLSAGALHSAPADAATSPAKTAASSAGAHTPAGSPAPVHPQGRTRVTAAVLDLDGTGREPTVHGADTRYDTASIVKVDILAAVLLQAQDAGRPLTAPERAHADAMIRHSDNAAATALWRQIGGARGLEAANKRLGLTATKGGPGLLWGLTQTTARDQIRLLRAVFDTVPAGHAGAPALRADSRQYIRMLMTRIDKDQAWGVSAAAASGWALKNGWLQRTTTGLWDINSIGQITVNKHRYLVAVLSDGSTSMKDGIALVQGAARNAVRSVSGH